MSLAPRARVAFTVALAAACAPSGGITPAEPSGTFAAAGPHQAREHPEFPDLDARLVSRGARVALEPHVVRGKVTLFDFYADWCAPCQLTDVWIRRWMLEDPILALRKIDVVSWESPVARQYLGAAGDELPHFVVYDTEGRHRGVVQGARLRTLRRLLDEAGTARTLVNGEPADAGTPP